MTKPAVVLLGPDDETKLFNGTSKFNEKSIKAFYDEYARFIAENFSDLMIVPADGPLLEIAKLYERYKHKKAIGFYPDKDVKYGYSWLEKNFDYVQPKPIGGNWRDLNAELTMQADVVICLGYSGGVMIELGFTKYNQRFHNKPKLIIIDLRTAESKLMPGFASDLKNLHYVNSFEEIKGLIQKLSEQVK